MANNSSQNNSDADNTLFSVGMNNYGDTDVVSVSSVMHKLGNLKVILMKLLDVKSSLRSQLHSQITSTLGVGVNPEWLDKGLDCEILSVGGKDWKKGKLKIRITLEFYPDEPEVDELSISNDLEGNQVESPLDDIRLMMDKLS